MQIRAIQTEKVSGKFSLFDFLDRHLDSISENSVLAVTSKIIAIAEGRVVPVEGSDKQQLIEAEADLYIEPTENKYNVFVTTKGGFLLASAGLDESNGNGNYILWPENPQKNANEIREHLKKKFNVNSIGVIITDSRTAPLSWGTTGFSIAYSGFLALKDYIDKPDIFGRNLHTTKANIKDALAAAVVLEMGEGAEQTPIAVVTDVPYVEFVDRNPNAEELLELNVKFENDLYAPLLKNAPWKKKV